MSWKDITREQFYAVYDKYPPNWWTRIAFKYFSRSTEKENMKPSLVVSWTLIILFLAGFFGTVFNLKHEILWGITVSFAIILATLVLSLFAAVFMNNARLKKVMKELGVTKQEYNWLAEKYG